MNVLTENTRAYLATLAMGLERDPISLDGWSCLHIPQLEASTATSVRYSRISLKAQFEAALQNDSGSVILCDDGDMIVVQKTAPSRAQTELAQRLIHLRDGASPKAERISIYDLKRDWRAVRWILRGKAAQGLEEEGLPPLSSLLGRQQEASPLTSEMEAFKDLFDSARQQRRIMTPLKVLVVEDDAITQRLATKILEDSTRLITAETAQEAIEMYLVHAPDMVFLDINLPDGSGLDVLQSLKACDPDAYIIMFSSQDKLEVIIDTLNAGASGFIAKPFHPARLRHYVNTRTLEAGQNMGMVMY